jgi:hypothetical protein
MSVAQVIAEIEALPQAERVRVAEETLRRLSPDDLKTVERFLRRIAHPDVPEEVWEGFEDTEDGRVVDLDMVLREEPPAR